MIATAETGIAWAAAVPIAKWVALRLAEVGIWIAASEIASAASEYADEGAAAETVPQATVDYILRTDVANYEAAARKHLSGLALKSMLTLIDGTRRLLTDPNRRPTRLEVDLVLQALWNTWERARSGGYDTTLASLGIAGGSESTPSLAAGSGEARSGGGVAPSVWLVALAAAGAALFYYSAGGP